MARLVLRSHPEFDANSSFLALAEDVEVGSIAKHIGDIPGGFTFRVPRTDEWVGQARPGRVVVVTARDETSEFFISQRRDNLASSRAVFQADPIHVILRDVGILDRIEDDGSSTIELGGPDSGMSFQNYWYTFLAPFLARHGLQWIQLGDVESDERLVYSWEALTPQAIIVALVDQLKHEWRLRRDAVNQRYLLDVAERLVVPDLVSQAGQGLNIISLRRILDRERMATVIRPIGRLGSGEPGDISLALLRVTARSGNDVTLASHADVGGMGPVYEADQWVGSYLEATDGTAYEITSTTTGQVLTLASGGSSFAVNDEVRLVADADANPVFEVASRGAVEEFGRIAIGLRLPFLGSSVAEVASLVDFEAQVGMYLPGGGLH